METTDRKIPKILVVANLKGGVGKTATVQSISSGLTERGYRVLAVDCDAQGNLSTNLAAETENRATVFDLLMGDTTAKEAIQHPSGCKFSVIPSDLTLAWADRQFVRTGKEVLLRTALEPVFDMYDYIILDTAPSLGIATINALMLPDAGIICPLHGKNSVGGFRMLMDEVANIRKYGNPGLHIEGLLLTFYEGRHRVCQGVKTAAEIVAAEYNAKLFETKIRKSARVDEANFCETDLLLYDPMNNVSADYQSLVSEMLGGERGV